MALTVGSRIAHYDVTALIGEGGMGQVYQATDTKLNRQVALKILPEAFATDPDRLARFQREAQVLASLNHPGIAAIYGIEEQEGTRALVLELVEGPTLADRISKGPIPLDEALPIAKQIAEALEAAHEAGVIHRDLKPANIKVRDDGTVKVLDFGLAKALDTTPQGDPSESPTLTAAATQMGVVLGTAAYMSPEQASGETVDKRSDIWSFGVVLFEMLTARRLFEGKTIAHVMSAVIQVDPRWDSLPTTTPRPMIRLLQRCLQKERRRRLRDIGDALTEIDEALTNPVADEARAPGVVQPAGWRHALPLALGMSAVAVLITGFAVWAVMQPELPRVARFAVAHDDAVPLHIALSSPDVAISPDGEHIAYLTDSINLGAERLHVRPIGQFAANTLVAEGELNSPFFSADGQSVGFYDRSQPNLLKRVSVQGGPSSTITEFQGDLRGASWSAEGIIVFGTSVPDSGLWRVAAVGGEPEQLTTPDLNAGEVNHLWPELLPDGKTVLFTIQAQNLEESQVAVLSLDSGENKRLFRGYSPKYVPTGHLVYGLGGNLWAVPFDLGRLEPLGEPVPVQEGVLTKPQGSMNFSVSDDGTLVYMPGTLAQSTQRRLVWVNQDGEAEELPALPRGYVQVSLSPDGARAAVAVAEDGNTDIWVSELARGTLTRLTTDPSVDESPLWSPDGRRVVFSSRRDGRAGIFWRNADGSGLVERLVTMDESVGGVLPYGWSTDGDTIFAAANMSGVTGLDIGTVPFDGSGSWQPLIQTAANERHPILSPDGRWLAYASNETGRYEVYVIRFPELDGRTPISVNGGQYPIWSADGRELFYALQPAGPPRAVTRVPLDMENGDSQRLTVGTSEELFAWNYFTRQGGRRLYDLSDGRFLMITRSDSASLTEQPQINVVLNWSEELKERVPLP